MLYDRDIWQYKIKDGKVTLEYIAPTQEAIFTREDLLVLLKYLDDDEICTHENIEQCTANDTCLQVVWVYSGCLDCGHTERIPIHKDLSVGDKEILSGEQI